MSLNPIRAALPVAPASPRRQPQVEADVAHSRPASQATNNKSSEPEHESGKRDLWEVAEKRLDEETKKWLQVEQAQPIQDVLAGIGNEIKAKYEAYKKGDLSVRKRDGGSIDMRGSAKKILVFTLQASDLLGGIAASDPTGHASAAWAVVSFGLTLVKNNIKRRDSIMEASEFLAETLAYQAIVDRNYRSEATQSKEGLEDALIDVYVAILRYTAEVHKASKETRGARIGNSIMALVETPLQDLKAVVKHKIETVDRWKTLSQDEGLLQKADETLNAIDGMVAKMQEINSRTRNEEDLHILDWLSTIPYSTIQNYAQKHRSADTGGWLLKTEEYIGWKTTSGSILWLHGAVGCGKSFLCSTVIRDVDQHCQDNPSDVFAYWYFQFSYEETRSVENMVRCLIRQLCPNPLPHSIKNIWEGHRANREPEYSQLIKILDGIVGHLPGKVYIVFDALDECPSEPGRKERQLLLSFLKTLVEQHSDKLHLLATSRPEPDIRQSLEKHKSLNLEDGLERDVETFVRAELKCGSLSKWEAIDASIHTKIEERLLGIPERQFRWADLQIKRLEGCHIPEDIYQALESIPTSLEDSYREIFNKIDTKYRSRAQSILTWLSFSLRPTTAKILLAVSSLPLAESIIQICTTALVTIDTDNIIRLAHFSVKEFLISEAALNKTGWCHISKKLAHRAILDRLLSELHAQSDHNLTESDSRKKPLLVYAATFWDAHMKELGYYTNLPPPDLQEGINHLFFNQKCYLNWIRLRDGGENRNVWYMAAQECVTPIHRASQMGLIWMVQSLLRSGADPMHYFYVDFYEAFENATISAAKNGHLSILEILLDIPVSLSRRDTLAIIQEIQSHREGRAKLEAIIEKLWVKGFLSIESCDNDHDIADDILLKAAGNVECGEILMEILLNKRKTSLKHIFKSLVKEAFWQRHPQGTLQMLFTRQDCELAFSSDLITTLSKYSRRELDIATLSFVERFAEDIGREPFFLEVFAKSASLEVMQALLQVYGEGLVVTDGMLSAAARTNRDVRVLSLLLETRGEQITISNQLLSNAARNLEFGLETMKALLDRCGPDRLMDEEIMLAAVSNPLSGLSILKELLNRQQAGFVVSESVLISAAGRADLETMQLLMANSDSSITVTESISCAAAKNIRWTMLEYILGILGPDFPVTEEILVHAARNWRVDPRRITMLLSRFQNTMVPDTVFTAAHYDAPVLEILLNYNQNRAPVQNILVKVGSEAWSNASVVSLLLDRNLVSIDERLVETLAGNSKAVQILLDRNPMLPLTEKALMAAASDIDSMRMLITMKNNNVEITEAIVERALASPSSYGVLEMLLTRLGSKVPITEGLLIEAADRPRLREFRLLLGQRRPLDLQAVWEGFWQREIEHVEEASDVLLEFTNLKITDGLLETIAGKQMHDYPEKLFLYAAKHHIPISSQGRATLKPETILAVFDKIPNFPVTEEMNNTVKENPDLDARLEGRGSTGYSTA
ncbi:hypothetical protein ASPZODRAFT_76501 [Penicilliopsis zonata CBS 506.65]|uniref:NACHT domain-containing protein n=1 Tax=Penicilliopsis zonata CBS 506.65 TaxID=1073090 RepID=A0A1L9S637_9EURO|nr:hypothetical protein ASPZODRAFT_76501 [Penicilliopsis zonata CBS 506.65]OJJ42631.1 hypothetical protein ASPZODRAFT_76501 [Penicilliopsis zonata CBS 506.65]